MSIPRYSLLIDLRWCLDELLNDGILDARSYHLVITSNREKNKPPLLIIN
mgnify:FL=1